MNEVVNTLLEIGNELAEWRDQITERAIQSDTLKVGSEKRETLLVPPGGWVGKNADERKAARDLVCSSDAEMVAFADEIGKADRDIRRMAARILALEDRRRALEFVARATQESTL